MKIRNLFQKTICSLITIIYVSKDKTIKQEASKYLRDLVSNMINMLNTKMFTN